MFRLIFILSIISIVSCQQVVSKSKPHVDEGVMEGERYISQEIGWMLTIPKGWTIMSKDKMDGYTEKGMDAIREVAGTIDYSGLKNLINFQKDQRNIFQSTSEPFKIEYEGEWEDNNEALKGLLHATFTNQGIKIDTSSSSMIVDELEFESFHITFYTPKGEIVLYQDMYTRLINGFDFGVSLTYNNEKDKTTLMDVWQNSKFKK